MKKYCSIVLVFKRTNKVIDVKNIIDNILDVTKIPFDQVEYYCYDSKNEKKVSKKYSFKNILKVYELLEEYMDEKSIIGISIYKKVGDKLTWPDYGINLEIYKDYVKIEVDMINILVDLNFIISLLKYDDLIISNGFVYYYSRKRINWMLRGIYVDFMWPSEIIFTKKMEKWLTNPTSKLSDIYYINIISKEFINSEKLNQLKKTIKIEHFLENNNYICFIGFESKSKVKRIIGGKKFI